jgi:hypothetical protein
MWAPARDWQQATQANNAGQRTAGSLDASFVREFVEPGRTATNIDKRPVF